ncbi:KOW domain-containing RNA-binding protein [Desnuesiella massiliensis]|uniref:KOW domain-containing RNA-binding protein n=1 Tax=Desnuesiella massiliensis TaxID=1650662 RepID=UPI001FA7DFA5|nr:KOW domain-containing RNA-binding protein [Desnuesiella massiliensis]
MTKVIIEVNILQDNDLVGNVVYSKAGRDEGNYYIIVGVVDSNYVLLADGKCKKIQKPKKKKIKHLQLTNEVAYDIKESVVNKSYDSDSKIRKFLKPKGIVKEV